jgi:membrane associated rhomboid family serine protease
VYFFYYIPVGLDLYIERRANVTYFLSAVCVIIFLVFRYAPQTAGWDLYNLVFQPRAPSFWNAISYVFIHGGWMHLAGNIVYLVLFGRALEDRFGPVRFYLIFLASAIVGAYTHLFLTQLFTPQYMAYPVVGASGATSGLLGAYMLRCRFGRIRVAYWVFMPLQGVNRAGRSYVPALFAVIVWFALQGVQTVMQLGAGGIQVAYSVHVGGFAAGLLTALFFGAAEAARAEGHVVKAKRHVEKAEWLGAQAEYGEYLEIVPDDAEAHAAVARTHICSSETGMARYHYSEAVRLSMAVGQRGRAEEIFTEAMRHIPGFTLDERLHLELSFGMERTLKFRTAASAYENFVTRYADSGEAAFVLLRMAGILENRFHRPLEALSCYRAIVERYSKDTWVDFARAEIERLQRGDITLSGGPEGEGSAGMK